MSDKGVDVGQVRYRVELIDEAGQTWELDGALQTLSWEEQAGQLAQKASLSVSSHSLEIGETIRGLLKLNRVIRILADWGEGMQPVFVGTIWEWQYSRSARQENSLIVYDPMIRLQQSKDFYYFSAGLATAAILSTICGDWGIELEFQWSGGITHEKKVFNNKAISDIIIQLLEEAKAQTGVAYAAKYQDGKLVICDLGSNSEVYKFDYAATLSSSDKLSLNKLVTRVKVIGKADKAGRAPVEAVIDGDQEMGVWQEIIRRDAAKTLGQAKAEAEQTLKERGKPEETISVTAADLPFLRKGDAVELCAGNLLGKFYVLGVSHNAGKKQMTMTLRRP